MTLLRTVVTRSSLAIVLATAALAFAWRAGAPPEPQMPRWMNYQGRLTSPSGAPVADGVYTATFRIFDSATPSGQELWSEIGLSITVQGGLFHASLGRTSPFPADLFSKPLWLQTEINSRTLSPRQEIGAVAFAMSSHSVGPDGVATSSLQDQAVTTPKLANGAVTKEKLADGIAIPIGGVVAWYGDSAQVPPGWKTCDGATIVDSNSPLNGVASPDLRNRFIRGVTGNVVGGAPTGGAENHTLTVAQMPSHSHGVNDPGHTHELLAQAWARGDGNGRAYPINSGSFISPTPIVGALTGISIQSAGGGQSFPLIPPYVGLVYIIRIR